MDDDNQGGGMFGGLSLLGVPNPTADGFLGKSFHEWYDVAGKMLAGETVPAILSSLSKDAKILRIGTGASVGIALIGLGMDYAAYRKGEISGGKFLLNQTMSAVGFFPPYATAASAVYFGVDAFYPGGWNGVGNDISNSVSNTWNTFTQGISQYNNIYKWVPHQ